jgi:hypothetical protein
MESYHVSNKIREISKRRPWLLPGWSAIEQQLAKIINTDY